MYTGIALFIFVVLTLQLLFPSNYFLPIDRRTSSVASATLVYVSHKFLLRQEPAVDLIEAIDWDVLLLLSAIMIINHIVVNLKETVDATLWLQRKVQSNPRRGFWLVAWTSFFVSPFLTNDGVCLLFVAPILAAFEALPPDGTTVQDVEIGGGADKSSSGDLRLERGDAIYFMFALACSANIGSSMTYTGNPQNMIVASDSIEVMPPIKFLGYMVVPAFLSFFVTIGYIEYCWMHERRQKDLARTRPNVAMLECLCCPGFKLVSVFPPPIAINESTSDKSAPMAGRAIEHPYDKDTTPGGTRSRSNSIGSQGSAGSSRSKGSNRSKSGKSGKSKRSAQKEGYSEVPSSASAAGSDAAGNPAMSLVVCGAETELPSAMSPISPQPLKLVKPEELAKRESRQSLEGEATTVSKVARIISSPAPYIMLVLLAAMICMIFVNVMAISGLICVSAIIMVLTLTYGNHWNGTSLYADEEEREDGPDGQVVRKKSTHEERVVAREEFFEEMFESIDMNLLLIFLGLFVVVANLEATGIPKMVWDAIVGDQPFATAGSVIGISAFVLVASQTLGNVAVCQLAVPNIEPLDDDSKRYAWAIVSFVATIGGNLLLTGSAANLIVAEKAMRVDKSAVMNFSNHAKVCFTTCLLSSAIGMGTITLCNMWEMSLKEGSN